MNEGLPVAIATVPLIAALDVQATTRPAQNTAALVQSSFGWLGPSLTDSRDSLSLDPEEVDLCIRP